MQFLGHKATSPVLVVTHDHGCRAGQHGSGYQKLKVSASSLGRKSCHVFLSDELAVDLGSLGLKQGYMVEAGHSHSVFMGMAMPPSLGDLLPTLQVMSAVSEDTGYSSGETQGNPPCGCQ